MYDFDNDGLKLKGSGILNGKIYNNGVLANGVVNGKYYRNGVLTAGIVTSPVLGKASGCNLSTVKEYDKNGNHTTQQIKVTQQANSNIYMLPVISGLDPSKITKVSSNADGLFTVIANNQEYRFTRTKVSGKTYTYAAKR